MISWIIIFLFFFVGFLISYFGSSEKYLIVRPDFFLFLSIFLYTIPISLNVLIGNNRLSMSILNLDITLICTFSFLVFFLIGFNLISTTQKNFLEKNNITDNYTTFTALLITFLGLFIYILNVKRFGGLLSLFVLQRGELMDTQNGLLSIGILIWKTGILLVFGKLILGRINGINEKWIYKFLGYGILIVFILLNILLGDRRIMVGLLLGIGFFYVLILKNKISVKKLLIPLVISVYVAHFISKVRHLTYDPLLMVTSIFTTFETSWLDISEGEVSAAFFVFNDLLDNPDGIDFIYGKSYLEMPVMLIPNFLVGQRSYNGLGDWFAKTYHYDIWSTGGGFGFPFIAETYLNFWFLGPVIIGLFTGIFLKLWWNYCVVNEPSFQKIALYALSLSMIFTIPRTDFAFVIKEFFLSSIFVIFLIKVINKLRLIKFGQESTSHLM